MAQRARPVDYRYKVTLIGDSGVGKTSLFERFTQNNFFPHHGGTIGSGYYTKTVDFANHCVRFEIWDTAGQERYRTMPPMYYRGSTAILLVYDTTQEVTLDNILHWHRNSTCSTAVLTLVGTKSDLSGGEIREKANSLADSLAIPHIETSAKDDVNITEAFMDLLPRVEPFATKLTPWRWTVHRHTSREVQLTVQTVLLCARRATNPQAAITSAPLEGSLTWLGKLQKWMGGKSAVAKATVAKERAVLPHIPWEIWFIVFGSLSVFDLKPVLRETQPAAPWSLQSALFGT